MLAAVSPEEDFVETYKYKVLADVGSHLTLKFPPSPGPNIKDAFDAVLHPSGAELPDKIKCVAKLTK